MEKRDFYIFTSSEHGKEEHPANTTDDFQVALSEYLNLETEWFYGEKYEWVCGVKEVKISLYNLETEGDEVLVLSDLCESSFLNSSKPPILQRLFLKGGKTNKEGKVLFTKHIRFNKPLYIPVKSNKINEFRVYLRTSKNSNITFTRGRIDLNLHFRRECVIMDRDFHMFISSEGGEASFPFNTADDFQILLSEYISLETHWLCGEKYEWLCGVKDISISFNGYESENNELLLLSDLCDTSFFNSTKLPLLLRLFLTPVKSSKRVDKTFATQIHFNDPLYMLAKQNKINQFRLYLRQNNGSPINYSSGRVDVTLHFKRRCKK